VRNTLKTFSDKLAMTTQARQETTKSERTERVPLGIKRSKLAVENKDPNMVYRWMNDSGARISDAERGGWVFVEAAKVGNVDMSNREQSLGARVSRIVGQDAQHKPITAYLMCIKKEFYEADQKYKQDQLDNVDAALRRGELKPSAGQYVPTQGIHIDARN